MPPRYDQLLEPVGPICAGGKQYALGGEWFRHPAGRWRIRAQQDPARAMQRRWPRSAAPARPPCSNSQVNARHRAQAHHASRHISEFGPGHAAQPNETRQMTGGYRTPDRRTGSAALMHYGLGRPCRRTTWMACAPTQLARDGGSRPVQPAASRPLAIGPAAKASPAPTVSATCATGFLRAGDAPAARRPCRHGAPAAPGRSPPPWRRAPGREGRDVTQARPAR